MASNSKCPYCGGIVSSADLNCPHCGASNANYVDKAPRHALLPRTIDEMKDYCAQRRIPLREMRFFVGENYRQPRAYGIYREGDRFIVYKNKSDGTRAIRYDGPDEAHAVEELYLKLMYECRVNGVLK
jgi:hypothetical protein